jgi:hypothetical protein
MSSHLTLVLEAELANELELLVQARLLERTTRGDRCLAEHLRRRRNASHATHLERFAA